MNNTQTKSPTVEYKSLPKNIAGLSVTHLIIYLLMLLAFTIYFFSYLFSNEYSGGILLVSAVVIGVVPLVAIWKEKHHYSKISSDAVMAFAKDNKWELTTADKDDLPTGLITRHGNKKFSNAFKGNYQGLKFKAYTFSHRISEGKNESTVIHECLRFELAHHFPLVNIIDKKLNFAFTSTAEIDISITETEWLEVEGNFNKRFTVEILKGTDRLVLELLTPDFLVELLDSESVACVELEPNYMTITRPGKKLDYKTVSNLFGMADVVIKHLDEISDSWQASSSPKERNELVKKSESLRKNLFQQVFKI